MAKNIFVIGLDEFNREKLDHLTHDTDYVFHPLLQEADVREHEPGTVVRLVTRAEEELEAFEGSVDGIVAYWDFPVQTMVPILRTRFGLPSPDLNTVLKCEHKFWSRREQRKAVPEMVPEFYAFDPFVDDPLPSIEVAYPFWVKPIKAANSELGFLIEDEGDFRHALGEIREQIQRFARSFDQILGFADLPLEIAEVTASYCLAEGLLKGDQHTISGYGHEGEIHIYGVVDSMNYPGTSSFLKYQYPSRLPTDVQERMAGFARKIMRYIDYDHEAFNIEFFYDRDEDELSILEMNPRISQSHGDLFEKVDGVPNHRIMVDLSVGRRPGFPHRKGEWKMAAKYYHRSFEDGVVARVPSDDEVRRIVDELPGTIVDIRVKEGDRLSEQANRDSYSFELAHIYVGGEDPEELDAGFERCVEKLAIEVDTEA